MNDSTLNSVPAYVYSEELDRMVFPNGGCALTLPGDGVLNENKLIMSKVLTPDGAHAALLIVRTNTEEKSQSFSVKLDDLKRAMELLEKKECT